MKELLSEAFRPEKLLIRPYLRIGCQIRDRDRRLGDTDKSLSLRWNTNLKDLLIVSVALVLLLRLAAFLCRLKMQSKIKKKLRKKLCRGRKK